MYRLSLNHLSDLAFRCRCLKAPLSSLSMHVINVTAGTTTYCRSGPSVKVSYNMRLTLSLPYACLAVTRKTTYEGGKFETTKAPRHTRSSHANNKIEMFTLFFFSFFLPFICLDLICNFIYLQLVE